MIVGERSGVAPALMMCVTPAAEKLTDTVFAYVNVGDGPALPAGPAAIGLNTKNPAAPGPCLMSTAFGHTMEAASGRNDTYELLAVDRAESPPTPSAPLEPTAIADRKCPAF